MADDHTERTPDQERATTDPFHRPERDGCGADVDEGSDEANEEGIGNRAELREERGAVVEDKVDTGPLLHHLKRCAQDGAANVAGRIEEAAGEAVDPAGEITALGDDLEFVFVVGDNLSHFLLNVVRVAGLASK